MFYELLNELLTNRQASLNSLQRHCGDFETQNEVILTIDELRTALRRSEIKETKWVATFGLALMKMETDNAQAFMDSRHGGGRE